MFEKVVESILVEYVSEWVEGLDAEKMKIALFGGKVEVRELKLKTAALDKFQLPVRVKAGTLGRLTLKVPWKRLTKEAVKLVIEDVFLMVVPAHQDEMQKLKTNKFLDDAQDSYALRQRFAKQQEIRVRELFEKSKNDDSRRTSDADESAGASSPGGSPSGGDTTSGWGYREKILHNILDNVSVEIKNIHIRYEDTTQVLAKNPFAVGITIDSILVNTTNANGHVTFVDRAQSHTPFVHKILEIVQAGLYCDDTALSQDLISRRKQPPPETYIISPFNISAKMTVNHDETTSFSIPKLQFVADIGSILASVTESQCNDMISAINYVSTHEIYLKRIHIRKQRPKVPVRRDAKSWWMYAFYGVQILYGLESKKSSDSMVLSSLSIKPKTTKCTWKLFGERWLQRKEYITLQKKILKAVVKKTPPEALVGDRVRMTELEDDLDVETIVFFRLCAAQEFELEGSRQDSVKKLTWKARWKASSSSSSSSGGKGGEGGSSSSNADGSPAVLRRLDPLEKLLLYTTVSEQLNASSTAIAAKEQERLNSKAILYALDLAVTSFTFSLVEPPRNNGSVAASSSSRRKEFLRFELDQFVFAIFQRTNACTISSSIKSIQMLDYSHMTPGPSGTPSLPQPLFYTLTAPPPLATASSGDAENSSSDQTPKFLELHIDSSETKLKMSCSFQPFRYIHHLAVASKLQGYFVIQVEVAPELKENAEEALAHSSVWLNNAVFAKPPPAAVHAAESHKQRSQVDVKSSSVPRVVEFSVVLPLVDVFVLSSDTSPILEAKLSDINFKSGNLLDTFEFAVDGVEITFIDGKSTAIAEQSRTDVAKPQHLQPSSSQNASSARTSSYYELQDRKRSTVLRKTRIVFSGEKKQVERRTPCWAMECTAPPIYFTLSSAQYQQVVQASVAWAASASKQDKDANQQPPQLMRQSATNDVVAKPMSSSPVPATALKPQRSNLQPVFAEEFDPNDERFSLRVHIPQILIVLEGGGGGGGGMPSSASSSQPQAEDNQSPPQCPAGAAAIDLVLDVRAINVEAKFSSAAQAIVADCRQLLLFKRKSTPSSSRHDSHGKKKIKLTTAEAISQVNESGPNSRTASLNDQPEEPDPAFHAETGDPTSKLIEIGQKVSFTVSSVAPFKGKLKAQQVVIYWDHDLLIALFRSYLWGNAQVAKSAPSSASSSRTSSSNAAISSLGMGPDDQERVEDSLADDVATALEESNPSAAAPFSLEICADKWFIFMRPHGTKSKRFALKLFGRALVCNVSTLSAGVTSVALHANNGLFLESSRFVDGTGESPGGDDICELFRAEQPIKIGIETAADGFLVNRTGAATFVSVRASNLELNYVHAHIQVLLDHLNKQIIGFFSWVGLQLRPRDAKVLSTRTKLDLEVKQINVLLPRGAVGNVIERERKPERLELAVKRLVIASRPLPKDPKVEQLLIRADDIQLASFLVETHTRDHTDAVASVDEAVARAQQTQTKHTHDHATALSKTTILVHEAVFVDYVSVPIPPKPKKKKVNKTPSDPSSEDVATSKPRRPLDLDDVAKEMENYCGFVRVALSRPSDWELETEEPSASHKRPPHLTIHAGNSIALAVEREQIELLTCLLDENFGRLELSPSSSSSLTQLQRDGDDEKQILDVQIAIGDVSLGLLRHATVESRRARDVHAREGVTERMVGRIDLEDVAVTVLGYASSRGQQRVVASRARFWRIDAVHLDNATGDSGGHVEHREVECGELYLVSPQNTGLQCIDLTIDQHAPSGDNASPLPLEVRLHIDACALLPSFATLITRAMPFLMIAPSFPGYEKKKGGPVSLSITTGMVHCMLAQHQVPVWSNSAEEAEASGNDPKDCSDAPPLNLVLSGCAVVRYSDLEDGLKHVQVFGRKMSLEISAKWPPLPEDSSADAVPPSPCSTPTYASTPRNMRSSTGGSGNAPNLKRSSPSLADYRRVLCDDFAVDLDLVDTEEVDDTMKVSASLTHFHAVLCTFDLFMLTQVQSLIEAAAKEAAAMNATNSRHNSRTNSKIRSRRAAQASHSSRNSSSSTAVAVPPLDPSEAAPLIKRVIVSLMLEDASVTFVREIGEYFSPLARVYSFCMMCNIAIESVLPPLVPVQRLVANASPPSSPPQIVDIRLHFTEESDGELHEDEGLSAWAFNAVLGSWEPIIEPWTFTLALRVETDGKGKASTRMDIAGSDTHPLNANFSPRLLDTFCAIAKEIEPLTQPPDPLNKNKKTHIPAARASVISCGFYLANDTGATISYWVSDHTAASSSANKRGFTYAPRAKRVPEVLQPRHKVPLKLSTAIFPSLPNDQTLSFNWGDDEWHPLTDVRIHSAGKYIYSVLPKASSRTASRTSSSSSSSSSNVATRQPQLLPGGTPSVLLALFDISAVFGYRTLTVSSLVRVFNETDVAINCGVLSDDGKSITDIGVIEPQSACGVPITMIRSVAGVRLLLRPHKADDDATSAISGSPGKTSDPLKALSLGAQAQAQAHAQTPLWEKEHRWSNEMLINDKDESLESVAACSLVLDDYDCKCQRMFDGSQPLHVSQICRANGAFFRVWHRIFTASNGSNLKYAQLHVFPTLAFENKCGVPVFVVAFVFKKVRRAGVSQDREYSHIVASEKIPARGSWQFVSSSLQESTFCSVSLTGFSWSKLFLLPTVFNGSVPAGERGATGGTSSQSTPAQPTSGLSSMMASAASMAGPSSSPGSPSARTATTNDEILCAVEDFKSRKASINVTLHGSTSETALRRVVIQPKYLICNETNMALTFEPSAKSKPRLQVPGTKGFFSLPSPTFSTSKPVATCCGSPQLEMIHSKLNALHGATTTSATPTTRNKLSRSASGASAAEFNKSTGTGSSGVAETEHFYCSETNLIGIQIEGNTQPSSGISQFRLDAAVGGSNSTIRLYDESKQQWHDVVVILEQLDAFTTKATFVERYVFLNRTDLNLFVVPACDIMGSLSAQDPTSGLCLTPHTSTPYHWSGRQTLLSDPSVRVKVSDPSVTGWRYSGRLSLHDVSESALKLSNKYTSQVLVVRIEVRVESSVRVFVVVSSEDHAPYPLYRVVNSSAHEIIHFKQSFDGGSGELSEQAGMTTDYNRGVTQRLFPGESTCFGWDEAFFLQSLDRVLEISYTSEAVHTKVLLDQPGEAQRIELPGTKTKPAATSVYVHWYLNGVTKTIHVHDTQLPRDKLTGKLINADATLSQSRQPAGIMLTPVLSEIALQLTMPNMMLSILNSKPEEVLLFTAENFDFKYASSRGQHDEFEVKIGSFQLDNQLSNAVFPVVLTPTPLAISSSFDLMASPPKKTPAVQSPSHASKANETTKDDSADQKDTFFHLSIFRLCYGDDVDYLKYMSAMVQPARLQIDDFLIISVALLSSDCLHIIQRHYPPQTKRKDTTAATENADGQSSVGGTSGGSSTGSTPRASGETQAASAGNETAVMKKIPPSERRMYIETLELHPFKIQVTFQQNNLSKAPLFDDGQSNFLLPVVFMVLKSNLVNVDSASINLNALHIYHSFTTQSFMVSAIQQHYAFQGVLQMYSLLGSADILGNPLGLVKNLGTGVKDFFYEPMAGMVKSPQEFVRGLSRGTTSLIKNSVYGTFNAASKFTGTLSSGIAALSMDSDYIKARNTRNRQEVATHIGTGIFYGTKQLGQGILAGVSGVITAPALGMYNNGLTGFVEGVGKGLIGVAVKPTAGILDLAARTTAGITATATVFDKKARDTRMRLPRMMHTSDKRLRVYSNDEAMICQLLHRLPQKLLRNEHYEAHVFIPVNRAVVATSHQFFHVDFNSIAGVGPSTHPRITWKFPLSSVWGAQKSAKGVSIFIGSASHVSLTSTTASSAPSSPSSSSSPQQAHRHHHPTMVTKSSMTTVVVPMKDTEVAIMDRLVKCISELVAKQRERAPVTETFSSPIPRNSIGMVLEPVRDSNKVAGYEGYGGRVVDVFVGSACFRAGVEVGDVIVGFGQHKFEAGDHGSALRTQLSMMKKGDTLELLVLRHGETKLISVATE